MAKYADYLVIEGSTCLSWKASPPAIGSAYDSMHDT